MGLLVLICWETESLIAGISHSFFDTPMGPSDKAVEEVLYQKSVLGRPGDVKELKAAYLVRFCPPLRPRGLKCAADNSALAPMQTVPRL